MVKSQSANVFRQFRRRSTYRALLLWIMALIWPSEALLPCPLSRKSGQQLLTLRLSAFGRYRRKRILRGPLSNIDSRPASNEQHRFKNPFIQIRLFQILIPQLNFGDFFDSIDPKRTFGRGLGAFRSRHSRPSTLITKRGLFA